MKKLIIILSLAIIGLTSCDQEIGTMNPGGEGSPETYVQVDSSLYRVLWVRVSNGGSGFYMMVPEGSFVRVSQVPEVIGFSQGKTHTSVIKVK